ncbi:MAG: hypothetical protein AUK47_01375 [Deltaproteobacteria bacterium CG2_30_63_29]|nr:MAG: hypothetical protein AUK47_01375 [Deltaproteobacteria bacterium CG2_30_63_29]PJB47424.1 MAG: hypothetical protein CO108_04145 [Deltaproteobacteria bacterium CG_4_9_14_3_um_filter_63_12]
MRFDRILFTALFLTAIVSNLYVIWSVEWLPLGDYGGHVELMDVVARYDSSHTIYSQVYTIPDGLRPNTATLFFAKWTGPYMDMDTSAKLLLSVYIVGLPLSILLLMWAFARSRWLALLSCPMVFNSMLNIGFLNYLLALPFLFVAVALARRFAESGSWKLGAALGTTLLFLYFAHIIPFLIALGISAAFIGLFIDRRKDLLRLWPLLLPTPLVADWSWRMFVALEATETGRTFGSKQGLGLIFKPWSSIIQYWHQWGMQYFKSNLDELAFGGLVGIWVLVMGLSCLQRQGQRAIRPASPVEPQARWAWLAFARRHSIVGLTLCCVVALFTLPSHMNEMQVITERVVLLILFFALAWPTASFVQRAQRWLIVPMSTIALLYPWAVQQEFQNFERLLVGDLPEMIGELPEATWMSYVMLTPHNELINMGPLWHTPKALHAVLNGGVTDDSFAVRPYTPVQYKPGQTPFRLSYLRSGFWRSPHVYNYDHILVRSTEPPTGALGAPNLKLRSQSGIWWLFDVRQIDSSGARVLMAGDITGALKQFDCPPGEVLGGFTGDYDDKKLTHLRFQCRPVVQKKPSGAGIDLGTKPKKEQEAPTPINTATSVPGSERKTIEAMCPENEVLVGLAGVQNPKITFLQSICAPLNDLEDVEVLEGGGFSKEWRSFELRCKKGEAAAGFRGRSGAAIDAVGLGCRVLDLDPVAPAAAPK